MAVQRNARGWARSIRLIFEDVGGELRLVAKQRVNMVPPPSPVIEQGQSGVWAERCDGLRHAPAKAAASATAVHRSFR
jgi:hypothetical protein